ncbi:hypothetical protein TNCV_3839061 [Trichonephila clavipes]|nr:hypothetical protein TNCV_3839061 [Trichonephila clavipes]
MAQPGSQSEDQWSDALAPVNGALLSHLFTARESGSDFFSFCLPNIPEALTRYSANRPITRRRGKRKSPTITADNRWTLEDVQPFGSLNIPSARKRYCCRGRRRRTRPAMRSFILEEKSCLPCSCESGGDLGLSHHLHGDTISAPSNCSIETWRCCFPTILDAEVTRHLFLTVLIQALACSTFI